MGGVKGAGGVGGQDTPCRGVKALARATGGMSLSGSSTVHHEEEGKQQELGGKQEGEEEDKEDEEVEQLQEGVRRWPANKTDWLCPAWRQPRAGYKFGWSCEEDVQAVTGAMNRAPVKAAP